MTGRARGSPSGKRAQHMLRKPFRQGDLDGLCGIYSIVNAVRVLCAELDDEAANWLFDELIQSINGAGANPSTAVAGGLGRGTMACLIDKAIAFVADEFDICLTVKRLPRTLRRTTRLGKLWGALTDAVSPHCVALLGLDGLHSHWTVAVQITTRQIRLFDSDEMAVLHRRRCTAGKAVYRHGISPLQVFLIERKDME